MVGIGFLLVRYVNLLIFFLNIRFMFLNIGNWYVKLFLVKVLKFLFFKLGGD